MVKPTLAPPFAVVIIVQYYQLLLPLTTTTWPLLDNHHNHQSPRPLARKQPCLTPPQNSKGHKTRNTPTCHPHNLIRLNQLLDNISHNNKHNNSSSRSHLDLQVHNNNDNHNKCVRPLRHNVDVLVNLLPCC